MSGCTLNARSLQRLEGVHPDLVRVVLRAAEIAETPFQIVEGLRSLERQRMCVRTGASRTMKSRHLTGHAVDVAPFFDGAHDFDWNNEAGYKRISQAFKAASNELGIGVEWGGDWKGFIDSPHFQLPWRQYPANSNTDPATEADLIRMGSRTARAARNVRRTGKALTAVAVGTAATFAADPVSTTTAAVTSAQVAVSTAQSIVETVNQGHGVLDQVREQMGWLFSPVPLAILAVGIGVALWLLGNAISAARVEDHNDGKNTGRG